MNESDTDKLVSALRRDHRAEVLEGPGGYVVRYRPRAGPVETLRLEARTEEEAVKEAWEMLEGSAGR